MNVRTHFVSCGLLPSLQLPLVFPGCTEKTVSSPSVLHPVCFTSTWHCPSWWHIHIDSSAWLWLFVLNILMCCMCLWHMNEEVTHLQDVKDGLVKNDTGLTYVFICFRETQLERLSKGAIRHYGRCILTSIVFRTSSESSWAICRKLFSFSRKLLK